MPAADAAHRKIPGGDGHTGCITSACKKNVTDEAWAKIQSAMSRLTFGVTKKTAGFRQNFLWNLRRHAISAEAERVARLSQRPAGGARPWFCGKLDNTNHTRRSSVAMH